MTLADCADNVKVAIEERLLLNRHVNESGCWESTLYRSPTGYARINIGNRPLLVHRVAYEIWIEPIPEGLEIDHLCSVRHCFNPAHLEAVTHRENLLRSIARDAGPQWKQSMTHCKRGHEFTPENTYRKATGRRQCRACRRAREKHARTKAGKP